MLLKLGSVSKTETQYRAVIAACKDIFLKKAQDYGPSWSIFRLPSITDQIFIKAERIRSIQEKQVNMVGDSIDGEFMAIVNYCIMALILCEVKYDQGGNFPEEWKEVQLLEEKYDTQVASVYNTMTKKNHDYGEAWRKMRVSSMTDLILVKLQRLKQIEDNEGETLISEKEDGHYTDIMNYAIFCLIKLSENAG